MSIKRGAPPEKVDGDDREAFLAECGRFAPLTSPEVVMLLSTSRSADAVIVSGGRGLEVANLPARRSSKAAAATTSASSTPRKR
jgi:hypothetical protein